MSAHHTVIFDLDGTLVDSAPGIIAAFRAVLAAHQIAPHVPLNDSLIGPPLAETLTRLTGETDGARLAQLTEDFKAAYDGDGVNATAAYAGVDALLEKLVARQQKLFVATNKRIAPTRAIVERLHWSAHFSSLYALDIYKPRLADKGALLCSLVDGTKFVAGIVHLHWRQTRRWPCRRQQRHYLCRRTLGLW
ncbi:MAG: HAD hydrolase-like protein [Rhodocyclaceae bacterium]|nr:HAD hydrolase-like protein [Rhodocyclaceae bacterium]